MVDADRGRRSLQADAGYCAVAGALVATLRRPIGRILNLPMATAAASGVAIVAWSGALYLLSHHAHRRWPVAAVGSANAVAALALLTAGTRHRDAVGRAMLVVGGLQVTGFAVSQAMALRPADPGGKRPSSNGVLAS